MPRRHSRSPTTTRVAPVSVARATAHAPTAQARSGVVGLHGHRGLPLLRRDAEVLLDQGGHLAGVAGLGGVLEGAHHSAVGLPGQHRRGHPGLGLVLGVRLTGRRPLHLLRGLRDVHRPVALDLLQGVVELVRRVLGVEDLLGRAPALRRPLLEQPERVAVAELHVAHLRLLHGGRDRDGRGPRRHPALHRDGGDGGGVARLVGRPRERRAGCRDEALLARHQGAQVAHAEQGRRAAGREHHDDQPRHEAAVAR